MSDIRPRRSVLYMPGSKERALEKAKTLAADALILDLEDAVSPAEKVQARDMVCAAVKTGGYGKRELIIRINGLDTEWGEADLLAACEAGPDAILIPKVDSAALIQDIAKMMDAAGAPEHTKIWAMMETPMAMLRAQEIAASHSRLTCFIMGTNDLVKDLHAHHTDMRLPIVTGLGLCMLAARAHDIICVDGVYNAFKDDDGLRASCQQGLEFGFDGKTLIHPAQLATTNEVFAPSADEIELAKTYVAAFEDATARGEGVAVVNGRIVENLHVENARRILALAEGIAALEADAD